MREAGWKPEWRVTSQQLLQHNFYLYQPGNSVHSPLKQMHWCPGNAHTKTQPASAGTLGERGRGGPSVKVFTLHIIRAVKLPPNQKRERMTGKNRLKGHGPGHTQCTRLHIHNYIYLINAKNNISKLTEDLPWKLHSMTIRLTDSQVLCYQWFNVILKFHIISNHYSENPICTSQCKRS